MQTKARKTAVSLLLAIVTAMSLFVGAMPAVAAGEPQAKVFSVSEFGDSYWYYGRTNTDFFSESLDVEATEGWTFAPTPIGFGSAGGRDLNNAAWNGTLATAISTGSGSAQRGSPLHTWTYMKKTFDLPEDFNTEEIIDVSGIHRIDDALVILINGVQVYRYNTNNNSREVMSEDINWGNYSTRNTDAVGRPFDINSNYDTHDTGFKATSSPNGLYDAASNSNLVSALKPGVNTLTCVVGNRNSSSSDLWFDLQLNITTETESNTGSGNTEEPVTLVPSYLNIAPGSNETQLNFSWHDAATTGEPIVRIWENGSDAKEYSGSRSSANSTLSSMRYNRVTVTGIKENTGYNYRVSDGNGNWSATYTTNTGSKDTFSYLVFGDPQVSNQNYGNQWRNTLEVAMGMFPNIAFLSSTGDQVDSATKAQYDYFFTPQSIFNSLPLASAMGNHESNSTSPLFFNPSNADSQSNYWYRYGDNLFMVWNSTNGNTTDFRNFLTNALAANPDATWKTLNFHYDVYGQGSSHALSDGKNYRDNYVPVLDDFGIDVVFNGHDHFYSRSYPMLWSGSSSTSNSQGMQAQIMNDDGSYTLPDGGTVYFSLSSSSGQKYYSAAAKQPYTAFMQTSQTSRPHFSIVNMTPNSFTCTTYELSNYTASASVSIVDTYTIVKDSSTTEPDPDTKENLILTTDKSIVRPDEYFNVSVSFPLAMESNVMKLSFTFDAGNFAFAAYTPADGATLLTREFGDGYANIMVMVPNYETESLGTLMLQAHSHVAVTSSEIAATATFVERDQNSAKEIKEAIGSYIQKTSNVGTDGFEVDLIVLSNLIDAMGTTANDLGWNAVSHFDFNGNDEIDIFDIVTIAQMIK